MRGIFLYFRISRAFQIFPGFSDFLVFPDFQILGILLSILFLIPSERAKCGVAGEGPIPLYSRSDALNL
jgi:hypothetical protein